MGAALLSARLSVFARRRWRCSRPVLASRWREGSRGLQRSFGAAAAAGEDDEDEEEEPQKAKKSRSGKRKAKDAGGGGSRRLPRLWRGISSLSEEAEAEQDGGQELLRSRHSWLVNAPLTPKVIGWNVFKQLSHLKDELAALLPESDQGVDAWESALRSEQLAESVRDWQQQLGTGIFDADVMNHQATRREKAERGQALKDAAQRGL